MHTGPQGALRNGSVETRSGDLNGWSGAETAVVVGEKSDAERGMGA